MSDITYFAQTDFRNEAKKFGIKDKDRLRHIYIIGKTGVGKSTLVENMIAQDILNGKGCALLDPHGASAEKMLDYIPEHRLQDVIYFAPFDMEYPISFNVMEDVGPDKRHHVANGILSVMKKIWVDAFSGRMEYIMQNTLLALMEYPGATLLGINRMLTDKEYRKRVIDNISDPSVKAFWVDEYLKWDERYQRDAGAAIQNKIGQFTSNPLIRNIVGQPKSSFNIREIMDNKKILIANFSKGLLGEQNARLLGSLLSTSIYLAAMSRAELSEEQMKDMPAFYLYVDEFQNFANDSFADVLSEARKYKLSLTMAHQYIAQMPDTVREAIFGNVGTMITMRIGPEDAEQFEREFAPTFSAADFTNLGPYQIYLRLMIDGINSQPFSGRTLPPIATPPVSMRLAAFQNSRRLYAGNRREIEKNIADWYTPIPTEKQIKHQQYLAKKKEEIEAAGGVWVDKSKEQATAEFEDSQRDPIRPSAVSKSGVSRGGTVIKPQPDNKATVSKPAPDTNTVDKKNVVEPVRIPSKNFKKEASNTGASIAHTQDTHQVAPGTRTQNPEPPSPEVDFSASDELKGLLSSLGNEQKVQNQAIADARKQDFTKTVQQVVVKKTNDTKPKKKNKKNNTVSQSGKKTIDKKPKKNPIKKQQHQTTKKTREASQDAKNALQAVLSKVKRSNPDNLKTKDSAKQDFGNKPTTKQSSFEQKTTLAKKDPKPYTDKGVAPQRIADQGLLGDSDTTKPKTKEVPLDVLREILED